MWLLIMTSLMFSVMVLVSGTAESISREQPMDLMPLRAEALRLERFRLAADLYVAANPTASGSLFWSTLRTAPGLPSAIAGSNMPIAWRAVANGAGGYTLCASVSDGAEVFLRDSMALRAEVAMYRSASGAVVMTDTPGSVDTEAAKC